jgi:hypothetical protein
MAKRERRRDAGQRVVVEVPIGPLEEAMRQAIMPLVAQMVVDALWEDLTGMKAISSMNSTQP